MLFIHQINKSMTNVGQCAMDLSLLPYLAQKSSWSIVGFTAYHAMGEFFFFFFFFFYPLDWSSREKISHQESKHKLLHSEIGTPPLSLDSLGLS
jgi:hypothetical protein